MLRSPRGSAFSGRGASERDRAFGLMRYDTVFSAVISSG